MESVFNKTTQQALPQYLRGLTIRTSQFTHTNFSRKESGGGGGIITSYPTPSLHKSVICDSFMKRDTDLRNGELPRNDFLRNTDSTDNTDVRRSFSQ